MPLDAKDKKQLVEARESIGAQLMQLEASARDPYSRGGAPDCRSVYDELQRQLREIDALLEANGDGRDISKDGYEPMVRLNADGSVGTGTGPTPAGKLVAIFSLAVMIIWIGIAFLRH